MVDIHRPCSMPSVTQSNPYCQNSYLPPLFLQKDLATGASKDNSAVGRPKNHSRHPSVGAEIHHGLRTPPGDMNGVSVNPLLAPHFSDPNYKSVPAAAWNGAPCQDSVGPVANGRCQSQTHPHQITHHNRNRSQEHTSNFSTILKERCSKTHGSIDESSIVSYLQIPSSINESKGSLAEFAAQVRPAGSEQEYYHKC